MKKHLLALAALAFATPVLAQVPSFPQTLPANTVVGRLGIGPGPSQAIPFAVLTSNLFGSLCTTAGAFPIYNATAAAWRCSTVGGAGSQAALVGTSSFFHALVPPVSGVTAAQLDTLVLDTTGSPVTTSAVVSRQSNVVTSGSGNLVNGTHGVGHKGSFTHNGSGTIPSGVGHEGAFANIAAGTVTTGIGVLGYFEGNTVGSTVTDYFAFKSLSSQLNAGTINRWVDYFSEDMGTGGSGTITARYSLLNEDPSKIIETVGLVRAARNGIAATSTDGLILQNTTAAAAGVQQWSPRTHWSGRGWKTNATAASQTVDFIAEVIPVQAAVNPDVTWRLSSQTNGLGYVSLFEIQSATAGAAMTAFFNGTSQAQFQIAVAGSAKGIHFADATQYIMGSFPSIPTLLYTNNTERLRIMAASNHLAPAGTAPALTSCGGGSPTIVGTDVAGTVTMGTTATGCVITFNVAYAAEPHCVVSWIATPLASQSYATSASAITLTQTSTSGNVVKYICMARQNG